MSYNPLVAAPPSLRAYTPGENVACLRTWGMEQQIPSLWSSLSTVPESWGTFATAEEFINMFTGF